MDGVPNFMISPSHQKIGVGAAQGFISGQEGDAPTIVAQKNVIDSRLPPTPLTSA
jgi:hypothetical protein